MEHSVGVGVQDRVGFDLLVTGKPNHRAVSRWHFELGFERRVSDKQHGFRSGHKSVLRRWSRRIFSLTGCALLCGLLRGGHVGVDMGFDPPGSIYAGGVNFKPVFATGIIGATHKGRSAHIGNVLHGLAGRQTVGNFDNRTLGVAIQKQITFGVYHHRAANFVRPVVVMGNAAQASFNSAQDNRNVFVGFAAALAVDNGGAVGALAADVTRGVGIIAANFSIRGIAVDHGIHVPRRHSPE